jgi:hypothetical protein
MSLTAHQLLQLKIEALEEAVELCKERYVTYVGFDGQIAYDFSIDLITLRSYIAELRSKLGATNATRPIPNSCYPNHHIPDL